MNFEPVAIVSAECRLPGAATLEEFFANNRNGVCSIGEADESFWRGCEAYDKDDGGHPNTSYTNLGGFLSPWRIEPGAFRIAPKVIERMDPVHMLAMDLAKRVLEEGEEQAPLPREETAVIIANVTGGAGSRVGANMHLETAHWAAAARRCEPALDGVLDAFQEQVREQYPNKREDLAINGESATIGGRIANYFDLHGTHYGIDAACGSSLAALHSGCMGLHQREFDAVLVAGVGILTPDVFVINSAAKTLSKNGSFPFGAAADGLVPGEGGVMMLLMRLEDARRAGRRVLGVIRGIGHSTNGRTTSTWAPSAEAEERAIRGAFEGLPFGLRDVDYVEAHGTSTYAGDGAELAAMLSTYGSAGRPAPLPFGSAKSMIGHTVESAGMVGMLRGMFLFRHGHLPPTLNVGQPRPEVAEAADRLRLQREVAPLGADDPGRALRVGVSAFGYGGINYHLLLEQDEGAASDAGVASAPATGTVSRTGSGAATKGTAAFRPARSPIAIIGMEAVAPEAPDLAAFWRNLRAGVASGTALEEFIADLDLYQEDPDLRKQGEYLHRAAFPEVSRDVDHLRWRILPRQVPELSDEILVLLSCASRLAPRLDTLLAGMERGRAGCVMGQLPDSDREFELIQSVRFGPWLRALRRFARAQGVDVPWAELREAMWHDPGLRLRAVDQDTSVSGFGSTLASVLASAFDLRGKSYAVRAACATGLAAVSLAAQELRQHTLDFVLCGAVGMGLGLMNHSALAAIRALSAQGVGRPYDADGDGFIMGGGAGLLCMKRLEDAERDGDEILAVLREVCGSSDGKGRSLLAPSAEGRRTAIERAYRSSGVDPAGIGFVEGHGAATALGDSTEVDALSASLKNRGTVYLGSVKGNLGHQKAASGMTALIKAVLCLQHGRLVPTPGYTRANPSLGLADKRFEVVTEDREWPRDGDEPLRAGVNAFGLAGINYHAIVEEYRPQRPPTDDRERTRTEAPAGAYAEVSGRGETRDRSEAPTPHTPLATHLWAAPDDRALSAALDAFAAGGEPPSGPPPAEFPYRLALVTEPGEQGLAQARKRVRMYLSAAAKGARTTPWDNMGLYFGTGTPDRRAVCRLYPGQGSPYAGMLRQAAEVLPGAAERVEEAAAVLAEEVPDLREGFWTSDPERGERWLSSTAHCQVATLLVSGVLDDWLNCLSVPAGCHLGHSFGEVSALAAAGGLPFADALRTAYHRGRLAREAPDGGRQQAMAVLFASGATGTELIGEDTDVVVANWNSRGQSVLAGAADAVRTVLGRAAERGVEGRALPIERAFHSPLIRSAVPAYRAFLDTVPLRTPDRPVYETLTSRPYPRDAGPARLRNSLAQQFVLPVYYETMIRDAYDRGARVFIEAGPKKALSALAAEILGDAPDVRTVTLLHPKGGERAQIQRARAQLWALGLAPAPVPPDSERAGGAARALAATPA
ncbi:beta-ketoacyl synthase N-terminal-like domain-containing protein [Streptomyces sp. ODS28]|uniref:beta-ketoacyl synthase N-terminal-like domain-containing protein n=1 Tax=Streptomyces sp. ODS28 TaxID=3136688 RepID=UPI0031E97A40